MRHPVDDPLPRGLDGKRRVAGDDEGGHAPGV
jgi:hypothetical protein